MHYKLQLHTQKICELIFFVLLIVDSRVLYCYSEPSETLMRTQLANFANMLHRKCRQTLYPTTEVERFPVPDDKVHWNANFSEYEPVDFAHPKIHNQPWADPKIDDPEFHPVWNEIDGKVNRKSYLGAYEILPGNLPQNPIGRTGIKNRGLLGRWGPNHAADPIITRWKRNGKGALEINRTSEKPILQFVAIERKDSHEWAIPGGMVDAGEMVSATLKREFMEEALNSLEKDPESQLDLKKQLEKFFDSGEEIYKGYVDDPRNTDNAWMETVACNFHDEDGSTIGDLNLEAGDDALNVKWVEVESSLKLYANHAEFLKQTAHKRNAHW